MSRLNFEKLDWPLKHCNILSYNYFIEWQIVLDNELLADEHYTTAVGVERSENIVFGQMNG